MRSGKKRSGGGVAGSSDFDSPPENTDEYSDAAAALQQNLGKGKDLLLQENEDFEDGDEYYEEREEDGERSDSDRVDYLEFGQEGDGEGDGGDDDEEENRAGERPKLAEGFYEIEAVRKKRKRKNVTQYLIKWRGWPESANTWEPLKNLETCSDLIEAFEESLQSGKGSRGRKRKGKHGVTLQPQSKKKLQQKQKNHSDDIPPLVVLRLIEDPLPVSPPINSSNAVETSVGAVTRRQAAKRKDETGNVPVSPKDQGTENDLSSINLSKAKGSKFVNMDNNSDDVFLHVQEGVAHTNGVSSVNAHEAGRKIGAKRRKSGAVKRFKPDSSSIEVDNANDGTIRICINGIQKGGLDSNKVDSHAVTEIIKAIDFSVSGSDKTQDVAVIFMVKRSDGSEALVSNKFLKAHYPLVLINYYEQHLRYTPPTQ